MRIEGWGLRVEGKGMRVEAWVWKIVGRKMRRTSLQVLELAAPKPEELA